MVTFINMTIRWVLILFASVLAVNAGTHLSLDARLLVKSPPVASAEERPSGKDYLWDVSALILVTNKGDRPIRLPTRTIMVDFEENSIEGKTMVLSWDITKERGSPVVLSECDVRIVEIRPGESTMVIADARLVERDIKCMSSAILRVSSAFARRYEVAGGEWKGAFFGNRLENDQNAKPQSERPP